MDNRFYLQALGITGLFIVVMILFWVASGGPASEAAVNNANSTRTAIAMTGGYLLQPRSPTAEPSAINPVSPTETRLSLLTSTNPPLPSVTNTSLLPQLSTPITPVPPTIDSSVTQTALLPTLNALPSQTLPPIPVFTTTPLPRRANTKMARVPLPGIPQTGATQPVATQPFATPAVNTAQDPAGFARWYFTRVWNERDYQNLWDNYLTLSYKTNVGSGLFEDYVGWWDSVQRVDVNAAEVLQNNGRDALVRVTLTFHMQDGRVVQNQIYEYDFLYDPARNTWMFDSSS